MDKKSNPSSRLNGAVVGVGHFGKWHAQKLAAHPAVNFVGIVDLRKDLADTLAGEYGTDGFQALEDVPGALDLVSLATPAGTHAALAREAIERGAHVLIEKPLATDVEAGQALLDLAKKHERLVQVDHQERYFLAESGLPGQVDPGSVTSVTVRRLGPPPPLPSDCSAVLDLTIHDLDWLHALLGPGLELESATGERGDGAFFEAIRVTARLGPRRVPVTIETSRMDPERDRGAEIALAGSAEPYHINFIERSLKAPGKSPIYAKDLPPSKVLFGEHPFKPLDYVGKSFAHFIHCIQQSRTPLTSGAAGLQALESALLIEKYLEANS